MDKQYKNTLSEWNVHRTRKTLKRQKQEISDMDLHLILKEKPTKIKSFKQTSLIILPLIIPDVDDQYD